jgi:hypothetical protein
VGTIFDLLALVGGYVSIMLLGGETVTNFIAKYVYLNNLIKDMYFTKIYSEENIDIGFAKTRKEKTKKYRKLYEKNMAKLASKTKIQPDNERNSSSGI